MIRRLAVLALTVIALSCTLAAAQPEAARDSALAHVLRRVTYGLRPGDIERVKAMGLSAWLERQLQPALIHDGVVERALATLPTLSMSIGELQRAYPRPDPETRQKPARGDLSPREMREQYPMDRRPARIVGELQTARMLRAVATERQLQEVMVDFWLNHFNVFAGKGELRWYLPDWERAVIRPHALGRFPALLRASARHPAMLFYLDNWLSTRPDFVRRGGPDQGRRAGLNENYARGAVGAAHAGRRRRLHPARRHRGRASVHRLDDRSSARGCALRVPVGDPRLRRQAGAGADDPVGGERDGEAILDMLARHPSTARFLAGKLVRRFVADDPPPALVERVAIRYQDTGGDIRDMLRVIVTSPEFLAPDTVSAKIKKPTEFVVSAVRAMGASADVGAPPHSRAPRPRSVRGSTRRSRPPATPIVPRHGSIPGPSWRE